MSASLHTRDKFIIEKIKRFTSVNFLLYILGRFKIIRLFYKNINFARRKIFGNQIESSNKNCLQFNINNQVVLNKLKKEGFYEGLKLNNKTIGDLINLSNKSELVSLRSKKKLKKVWKKGVKTPKRCEIDNLEEF